LIIKLFEKLDDNLMIISFTKRLLRNQTSQIKPLSKSISQLASSSPSSYQPPDTVGYLCFLYGDQKIPKKNPIGREGVYDENSDFIGKKTNRIEKKHQVY
jgi:hypothetical protein